MIPPDYPTIIQDLHEDHELEMVKLTTRIGVLEGELAWALDQIVLVEPGARKTDTWKCAWKVLCENA